MKRSLVLALCFAVALLIGAGIEGGWWSTGIKGPIVRVVDDKAKVAVVDDKARVALTDDWEARC